jgi:hypothetical protein
MINLNFGVNNVALTLSEDTNITYVDYLFQFINATSLEEVVFIAQDVSNFKERYNLFVIELVNPNQVNLRIGKIHLNDTGYWTYNIYQQPSFKKRVIADGGTFEAESCFNINLDVEDAGTLVETGKVLYNFTQDDTIELEQDNKVIIYG